MRTTGRGNQEMKLIRRRQDDAISGKVYNNINRGEPGLAVAASENILRTSITERIFNIEGIKQLNISPYMLVDRMISNVNIGALVGNNKNKKEILTLLLRNEMIRVSYELNAKVDDKSIDNRMNVLGPDIDTCIILLDRVSGK